MATALAPALLIVYPPATAIAFTVSLVDTVRGPPGISGEDAVGVDPSVVYKKFTPGVASVMNTICAEEYVPPGGLKVGGATFVDKV